jgi:hypothetical protein
MICKASKACTPTSNKAMKPKKQRLWSISYSHGDGTGMSGSPLPDEQVIALIKKGFSETDTVTFQSDSPKKLPKRKVNGPTGVQG